jgi:hypothetical protein
MKPARADASMPVIDGRPRLERRGDSLLDAAGRRWAALSDASILTNEGRAELVALLRAGPRVIAWSGSLGEDLWSAFPRNWMMSGRDALRSALDDLAPVLAETGTTLLVRPHRHHVISDIHTCADLFRERAGQPIQLALDPASMLAPSMLGDIEEHLGRMLEILGPIAGVVMLGDIELTGDDVQTVPFGSGVMPRERVSSLMARLVPADVPAVLF